LTTEQFEAKGRVELEEKDYIETLENLLIFMCQTYEGTQKALLKLSKEEDNDAFMKVPMIQGTPNAIGISELAKNVFYHPNYGFNDVAKELSNRRG
jgi:hypothetical protein